MSASTRAELVALAALPCAECGQPVQRVEQSWQLNGDGDWVPRVWTLVCQSGHRKPVEPL